MTQPGELHEHLSREDVMGRRMSRRAMLGGIGRASLALPGLAAILAACSKPTPDQPRGGGGSGGIGGAPYPIARKDAPVTLPPNGEPVPTDAPLEDGTLQIFQFVDYLWKKVLHDWETKSAHEYEWTTYSNSYEATARLSSGQVAPDVYFPLVDTLGKLTASDILQPLNHDLIPNIGSLWPEFSGDDTPFYDQGWQYTVPYTIYTTGIAYRRDHVSDEEVRDKGYDILWDPKYRGQIGIYDVYREALGMAMLRRHGATTDLNTGDQAIIDQAKDDLIELIDLVDVRTSTNGAYAKLPEDDYWIHQSWSGDIVTAQYFLPKGVPTDVLGFYLPDHFVIGNDTMAIPAAAEHPVLAHDFINYLISDQVAWRNFSWVGYQPPLKSMDPTTLVEKGYVPETTSQAIVLPDYFETGKTYLELTPDVNGLWQDAWDEFKASS